MSANNTIDEYAFYRVVPMDYVGDLTMELHVERVQQQLKKQSELNKVIQVCEKATEGGGGMKFELWKDIKAELSGKYSSKETNTTHEEKQDMIEKSIKETQSMKEKLHTDNKDGRLFSKQCCIRFAFRNGVSKDIVLHEQLTFLNKLDVENMVEGRYDLSVYSAAQSFISTKDLKMVNVKPLQIEADFIIEQAPSPAPPPAFRASQAPLQRLLAKIRDGSIHNDTIHKDHGNFDSGPQWESDPEPMFKGIEQLLEEYLVQYFAKGKEAPPTLQRIRDMIRGRKGIGRVDIIGETGKVLQQYLTAEAEKRQKRGRNLE